MKIKTEQMLNKVSFTTDFIFAKFSDEIIRGFFNRTLVLLMITALFLPLVVFQPLTTVSAKTNEAVSDSPPPVSEPPLPFNFSASSDNSFVPAAVSSAISSVFAPVADFFTAPELPLGFSAAHISSPAYSYLSSFGDSIASGFAFISSTVSPTVSATNPPSNGTEFDYDGDGKADPAVWHQQSGNWKVKRSSDGTTVTTNFGVNAAFMTPGDFDGDSISDLAVFNQGTWAIFQSSTSTVINITLGTAGDRPVSGDFDGDGISDAAVFHPSTGEWIVKQSSTGNTTATVWGISTDVLVPGDFDGDGKTDLAVFRPADQYWYILGSSSGYYNAVWGLGSDLPIPADYDGDNKTDLAVFRPSTGSWYILKSSSTTGENISQAWGNYNDQPVPADYDGDGKADFAVFRPKTGMWHILKSSDWGYQGHTLGISTDKLVEAAYLKQNGSVAFDNAFARTRLSPRNATGGTNLYSQNFGWGTGLVRLPGRAGLDAGLGIGYNSLVWIKHNNTMVFDPDYSNVSPGFRMGFPTIEPIYYDGTTEKYSYMMVSPSGARTEFRQTLVSNKYETADSSYLQLIANGATNPNDPAENITLTVWGTDGTQMNYEFKGGSYNCTQIKDSNGNFITIGYDDYGLLKTVTDTLGRVITVNYDADNFPLNITGQWKAGNGNGTAYTHVYATFEYAVVYINPGFAAGMGIYGPQGLQVKSLSKVIYGDGGINTGETRFEYNNFGQVKKIRNFAIDGHELNYAATNLVTPGTGLYDVPRLTQTRTWVENYNGIGDIPQETIVNNSLIPGQQTTNIDGATVTASIVQVQMQNHPNENITNAFVGESGWMEGLPIRTDDYTQNGNSLKRTSWTKMTQDDTSLSYIKNPRVIETKVGDTTNTKRTTIDYLLNPNTNTSVYGLVGEVKTYKADQVNVIRKTVMDYDLSSIYLDNHIIGLPVEQKLFDENGALMSKVTLQYDEGDFSGDEQNISPIQHDSANYGANYLLRRGNRTSVTRWDANYPDDGSQAVTSRVKYNTAGAAVSSIDPVGREVKISYVDSFNDGQNRNTYAYPKTITDPAGFSSNVKYRYDTGANVWAKSPTPQGAATSPNSRGKETERIYDSRGRLERQILVNSGAYTRYGYPTSQVQSKVYTTVVDRNNNGADAADEVLAESWADGAGRTRMTRTPMTFDASGGTATWVGQQVEYDVLGRVKKQSVPTEINGGWSPTGSDLTRGWQWTSQEYDWKGRVTKEVKLDNVDIIYSYDGCGCAGGQVTTIQGEQLAEGRRTQKIYADILGRTKQTDILDYSGNVYTSVVNEFNGRDQVTMSRRYEGEAQSGNTYQESTITYDGHGRTKSSHAPQQEGTKTTDYTYYADDRPHTVTDARGASSIYYYNNRGQTERIDSSLPGAANTFPTINANTNGDEPDSPCSSSHPDYPDCMITGGGGTPPPQGPYLTQVTFGYDAAGNRVNMTDSETGITTYDYDELSRMTAEHKEFKAIWQIPTHNFDVSYTYNLIGQLKSVTDPFGERIDYATDKAGKLEQITGTPFGGNANNQTVTNYINDIDYRAWGAVKEIDYGNGVEMTQTFDNRLNLAGFKVEKPGEATPYIKKDYQYHNDGRLKFSDDGGNNITRVAENFDRSYKYDFMGRLTEARTGIEANGGAATDRSQVPYKQDYAYNAFGNVTSRQTYHWTEADNQTNTWTNNKEDNWTYDADGRLKQTPENKYYYDARGAIVMSTLSSNRRMIQHLDGEGKPVHQGQYQYYNYQYNLQQSEYYIYSTVLGKRLTEIKSNGTKKRTFVYGVGGVVALQQYENNVEQVRWEHTDPSNAGYVQTSSGGVMYYDSAAELDPLGSNVGLYNPYGASPDQLQGGGWGYGSWGDPFGGFKCMVDWMERPCSDAAGILAAGAGVIYNGPQFQHDGLGWGQFRCEAGDACGYYYYYDYEYDLTKYPWYQPGDDPVGLGVNIYFHPGDVDSGPFWFDLNPHPSTHEPPIDDPGVSTTPSSDPCAGNKGNINPNPGSLKEGIDHLSDRHITPQGSNWIGKKSYFTFGFFFTKGRSSFTKKQKENVVMNMMQEAFEKGAATQLPGGDYTYSYAPFAQDPTGSISADFIGIDVKSNGDATNVRTVVLRINNPSIDCQNPTLITGFPGLMRPTDNFYGFPRWKPVTLILPF